MLLNNLWRDDEFVLEDLWKTKEGLMIIAITFLSVYAIIFVVGMWSAKKVKDGKEKELNKMSGYTDNNGAELQELPVKIVSKFTSKSSIYQSLIFNNVMFEFENGSRITLILKYDSQYNALIAGDEGILTYRGKRFIKFERNKA